MFLINGLEGSASPLMKGMVVILLIETLCLLEELEREEIVVNGRYRTLMYWTLVYLTLVY